MAHDAQNVRFARLGIDRSLGLLIVGAVALILVGLIVLPFAASRPPALAPPTTPEGTVQRFYQAVYERDYDLAYGFLSSETQRKLPLSELQQQLSTELQATQTRTTSVTIHGTTATVEVSQTHFQATGGLLGPTEWTSSREVLLAREGEAWKIVSGAFYLPPAK